MAELATAYVSVLPSMRGFRTKVSSELRGTGDRAGRQFSNEFESEADRGGRASGRRFGGAFKAAVGGLIAGISVAAITRFASDSVAAFSELEDSTAAASVVFGKSMTQIIKQSQGASKELGLSEQQVISAANTFGTYGKAAGLSGKELANFATEQTALAADMASFKGTSPEQAIEAIGAALRGEMEPIRTYGVLLDDATLRNEALKMGLISTTKDALTPQQKTLAAQSAILKQTTDAQGDFARTQDSTANVAKTLTANAANLRAEIGEKLAPAFTAVRLAANDALAGISAAIDPTVAAFQRIAGWVRQNADLFQALGIGVGVAVAAFAAYRTVMFATQVPMLAVTAAQWALNAALTANPIGIVVVAIGALVAALVYLYKNNETARKIIDAAWLGIKVAIKAVVDWLVNTAWPFIQRVWSGIRIGAQALWTVLRVIFATWATVFALLWKGMQAVWNAVGQPVFNAIRTVATNVWNWLRDNVFNRMRLGFELMVFAFRTLKARYWDPVWSGIRSGSSAAWGFLRDRVFSPLKAGVKAIGDAFRPVARVISAAWDGIKAAAAKPVNFIIETVYTNGIKKTWDKIADSVGLDLKLPVVNGIKGYATGGILPGYTPGRDVHRFYSPTGGTLDLSGGEPILRPEAGRVLGSSWVNGINSAARHGGTSGVQSFLGAGQAYKDGGFFNGVGNWFGDAWDTVKDAGSSFLSGPAGFLKKVISGPMNSALGNIGGGTLGKIASAIPRKVVSGLVDRAKDMAGSLFGGGSNLKGGGRFAGGNPLGWQAMWNVVRNAFPGASLNSAFRPGAITAVGTPSFHGRGRAIDVSPSMAIFNWLARTFPNSSELIFSPAGGRQLYMGKKMQFGEPTRGDHWDHVHWAMKNGGVVPNLYDNGGWLPNGGLGVNTTGKPEAVLTPDESRALKSGLNQRPVNLTFNTTRVQPRDVVHAMNMVSLLEV